MKKGIAENQEQMTGLSVEGQEKESPQFRVSTATEEKKITGMSLSRGLAIGHAVLYEPCFTGAEIISGDAQAQIHRLRRAVGSMHEAINRMLHHSATPTLNETRDILEAYLMFARDRGWLMRIEEAITKGLSA